MKKLNLYFATLIMSTNLFISMPIKAEETVFVNKDDTLRLLKDQDSISDWFLGLFNKKPEKETIFVTKENLVIDNYKVNTNENGTTTVKMNIYNKYVLDGLVEIYDENNRLVDLKVIEANKSPENLIDAGFQLFTEVPTEILTRNITDLRTNTKKSSLEFTLKKGQRWNINMGGNNVLIYNLAVTALETADLGSLGETESLKLKEFLLKFVKDWELNVKSEISKDLLLNNLSGNRPLEEKLRSKEFIEFSKELLNYLVEKGVSTLGDQVRGKLSEGLEKSIAILSGPVGRASELVFYLSKATNAMLRFNTALQAYNLKPTSFVAESDLDRENNQNATQLESNNSPNFSPQVNIMQNQLTAITQGGSSHIGSAAYFIGRSPLQDQVRDEQFNGARLPGIQEKSQYTDGIVLTPPVDIVLKWDQSPQSQLLDLDSHLTGPATADPNSTLRFHTYFAAKGSLDSFPNVSLYRDVIPLNGDFGPEQTRINVVQSNGVYRFYVHDYTNRDTVNSSDLSNSKASVTIHNSGSLSLPEGQNLGPQIGSQMNVPTGQQGNTWAVFELDSRTGILRQLNIPFGNISDPNKVPSVNPNEGSINSNEIKK